MAKNNLNKKYLWAAKFPLFFYLLQIYLISIYLQLIRRHCHTSTVDFNIPMIFSAVTEVTVKLCCDVLISFTQKKLIKVNKILKNSKIFVARLECFTMQIMTMSMM